MNPNTTKGKKSSKHAKAEQVSLAEMQSRAMECNIKVKYELPRLKRQVADIESKIKEAQEEVTAARTKEDLHLLNLKQKSLERLKDCRETLMEDILNFESLQIITTKVISSMKVQQSMSILSPDADQNVGKMLDMFNEMNSQYAATRGRISSAIDAAQGPDSIKETSANVAKQKTVQENAVLNYLDQMNIGFDLPTLTVGAPTTTAVSSSLRQSGSSSSNSNNSSNDLVTKKN